MDAAVARFLALFGPISVTTFVGWLMGWPIVFPWMVTITFANLLILIVGSDWSIRRMFGIESDAIVKTATYLLCLTLTGVAHIVSADMISEFAWRTCRFGDQGPGNRFVRLDPTDSMVRDSQQLLIEMGARYCPIPNYMSIVGITHSYWDIAEAWEAPSGLDARPAESFPLSLDRMKRPDGTGMGLNQKGNVFRIVAPPGHWLPAGRSIYVLFSSKLPARVIQCAIRSQNDTEYQLCNHEGKFEYPALDPSS